MCIERTAAHTSNRSMQISPQSDNKVAIKKNINKVIHHIIYTHTKRTFNIYLISFLFDFLWWCFINIFVSKYTNKRIRYHFIFCLIKVTTRCAFINFYFSKVILFQLKRNIFTFILCRLSNKLKSVKKSCGYAFVCHTESSL